MNKKYFIFISIILLTLIAFLLRVLPFGYGMAHIYFNDTFLFSKALNLANGIAHYDLSQFRVPGTYPYFFSYIFLFGFGIFYLVGLIGGIFSSANDFLRYTILEMEQLFEMSRIIIAVFGALLIPLVYLITRKIILAGKKNWAELGAFLAAFLMCFSLLHIHYSHLVRPHLAVAFTLFLSFYFYLLLLKNKSLIFYILLGMTSGFAAGTLHSGFLAVFFLIIAHFFIVFQQKKKRIFSFPFIMSLIIFSLIVFICWPYLILNLERTLGLESGKFDFTLSGQSTIARGSFSTYGLAIAFRGLVLSETSLISLLIIFLVIYFVFLKKRKKDKSFAENYYYKAAIIGGGFVAGLHFLVFSAYEIQIYKFLVPLIPFLCVFAGILFSHSLELISKKYRFWLIAFVVIIVIFSIIQSLRLTTLIVRKDTRDLAAEWVEENISPSKIVAISGAAPKFFPNRETLEKKLSLIGPDSLGQRDRFLLSIPDEEYPQDSRLIFFLWPLDKNYRKVRDFLKNQSDYFIFVRYNLYPTSDSVKDFALKDFEQRMAVNLGEVIKTFNPFNKLSKQYSEFPLHIDNPIIDLWALNRMGPLIEIYKLK